METVSEPMSATRIDEAFAFAEKLSGETLSAASNEMQEYMDLEDEP